MTTTQSTRRRVSAGASLLGALGAVLLAATGQSAEPPAAVVPSGDVGYLGEPILVPVAGGSGSVRYTLDWVVVDGETTTGARYEGEGTVRQVAGIGPVASLPTSALPRKGVYVLSGEGFGARRVLLVDPVPDVADPTTWRVGLITSRDALDLGAGMAEEFYRVGMRWFHFDFPITEVNRIGEAAGDDAAQVSAGFDEFMRRAAARGLMPIFKLMNHYEEIAEPGDLDGPFYEGLRRLQRRYGAAVRYWVIGNEVEGGGYSRFTPEEYERVIHNMARALRSVDPGVKLLAGEFYAAENQHLPRLMGSRDDWDVLSVHKVVGNSMVSEYLDKLRGLDRPIWDTEANGTIFGGPSEWSNYMHSDFPIGPDDGDDVYHSGIQKHMLRSLCLEARDGGTWRPAFYNPATPCLGVDLVISMHYNASWENQWALRRHWISSTENPSEVNHKVAGFRTLADFVYGASGLTRIPNTDVPDPYRAPSDAPYERADGYIYQYGPEYLVALWQNTGRSAMDRELVLTTDRDVVLFDSLGTPYPLRAENGRVKIWVRPDVVYVRGLSEIPHFALDDGGDDAPYFVTEPVVNAVASRPYSYTMRAYDSDVPNPSDGEDSLPRIDYALVAGPDGMALRGDALTWVPPAAGRYPVTVRATSRHGATAVVDQAFTIEVVSAADNLAPVILSSPATGFARPGFVWWYNLNAYDPNDDPLTYRLVAGPEGMRIDAATGFVQWTPTAAGSVEVVLEASDGRGRVEQRITLTAGPVEAVP